MFAGGYRGLDSSDVHTTPTRCTFHGRECYAFLRHVGTSLVDGSERSAEQYGVHDEGVSRTTHVVTLKICSYFGKNENVTNVWFEFIAFSLLMCAVQRKKNGLKVKSSVNPFPHMAFELCNLFRGPRISYRTCRDLNRRATLFLVSFTQTSPCIAVP